MNGESNAHPHAAASTPSAKRLPAYLPATNTATGTASTHSEYPRFTGAASHTSAQAVLSTTNAADAARGLPVSTANAATNPQDSSACAQAAAPGSLIALTV